MNARIFADREEAGWQLVERLRGERLDKPLVLAIPRGGVEVGAALASGLGAELDVVLARKLRAPHQPELAIGAVAEGGTIHLNHFASAMTDVGEATIEAERRRQVAEIERQRSVYRPVRPQVPIGGRHVIVTDDGIATGATMIAALRAVRAAGPATITVALPVAAPERIAAIRPLCDRVVCLEEPDGFMAVGQFYRRFPQVEDDRVVALLRELGTPSTAWLHPDARRSGLPSVRA